MLKQSYKNFEILLIDDGSSDGTADAVKSLLPATTVITGPGNWWWAGSLQQGYDWLRAQRPALDELVLIANDDTTFGEEFLEEAVRYLACKSRTLLLAQPRSHHTGKVIESRIHLDWDNLSFESTSDPGMVNCLSTRGLFLRIRDLYEIGGFHPKLLPHYFSDFEYTYRAHKLGMTLVSTPEVNLVMDEKSTGIREARAESSIERLKMLLQVRASGNPFYFSAFVMLACPASQVVRNLLRVWIRFAFIILRGEP